MSGVTPRAEEESERDVSTQTAFAVIAGVAAVFVALIVLVFYLMRDKTMSKEIVDVQRRFDAFKVLEIVNTRVFLGLCGLSQGCPIQPLL